jgi:hypothetical protein
MLKDKPTSGTSPGTVATFLFRALWSLPCSLRQGHASEQESRHVVGLEQGFATPALQSVARGFPDPMKEPWK